MKELIGRIALMENFKELHYKPTFVEIIGVDQEEIIKKSWLTGKTTKQVKTNVVWFKILGVKDGEVRGSPHGFNWLEMCDRAEFLITQVELNNSHKKSKQ